MLPNQKLKYLQLSDDPPRLDLEHVQARKLHGVKCAAEGANGKARRLPIMNWMVISSFV